MEKVMSLIDKLKRKYPKAEADLMELEGLLESPADEGMEGEMGMEEAPEVEAEEDVMPEDMPEDEDEMDNMEANEEEDVDVLLDMDAEEEEDLKKKANSPHMSSEVDGKKMAFAKRMKARKAMKEGM